MVFDIAGVTILMFSLFCFLTGLYLLVRTRSRIAAVLIMFLSILAAGVFIFMVASTPTRRAYINLDMRMLAASFLLHAAAIAVAGVLAFIIYRVAKMIAGERDVLLGLLVASGMLIFVAPTTLWLYQSTFEPDLHEVFVEAAPVEGIVIEENIPIQIFENEVVKAPTALELGPENELYVASNEGFVWVILDDNLDGVADNVFEFASGLSKPQGIAWSEDGIYVNVDAQLILLKDTDGDWIADDTTVIVDDLPGEVYAFHRNHGITFGPGGRLYIGVGATTDHDEESHPLAARILSLNPDGSDLQVYATGTRNPYGLIASPDGEGLFAIDNGAAGCTGDNCEIKVDVPEEVNYIREGNDYGFPKYFGVPEQSSDSIPPIFTLPEHSAPTGIVFYEGDSFPERFKGQLFVSLWTAGDIYRVRLYKIDEDHYTGSPARFATGIPGPSAMVNSPSGGLYVASFNGNAIYHIGKVGGE